MQPKKLNRHPRPGKPKQFTCHACKETKDVASGLSTGYGRDDEGNTVCYACCGKQDREWMKEKGKFALYLCSTDGKHKVTNWPGTLKFPVLAHKEGRHNIAGSRYDVWFYGPDDHLWHGVQYGEWTQVCHCKRTKQKRAQARRLHDDGN